MTAHTPSDNAAIEAAQASTLNNARRYFLATATALAAADDPTSEALWSAHDSASRALRSEGLAELRRRVSPAKSALEHRTMGERGERALTRRSFVCAELDGDGA